MKHVSRAAMLAAGTALCVPAAVCATPRADGSDPKALVAQINQAFEEFKATNDAALKNKADDTVVSEKLANINAAITEMTTALEKAQAVYSPPELAGMEAGVLALYQKCPHLGCRVPECVTSQWFECPCHGSQYNQVGEKKGGPAPRGLDRFAMTVSGGRLSVDTGTIIQGPPIGTNTTGQEAEGPHCIGAGSH